MDLYCRSLFLKLVVWIWLLGQQTMTLDIPTDVEILEGYEFEDSPEYYGTDANYYEVQNMNSGHNRAIRNKRSAPLDFTDTKNKTKMAEFKGQTEDNVISNVNNLNNEFIKPIKSTTLAPEHRQLDYQMENETKETDVEEMRMAKAMATMPKAEKQIMDPDYDYYSQRQVSGWKVIDKSMAEEEDTVAEASTGYGNGGRQARVNFVTQPLKENEAQPDVTNSLLTKITPHQRFDQKYGPYPPPYNYELYPSRSYDPYLRRYDRYDEQYSRYNPYNYEDQFLYRRHYDPFDSYSPRIPQAPEPYYTYPDHRYDLPEPRDFFATYNQNMYEKGPYTPVNYFDAYTTNRAKYPPENLRNFRRVVYYAHLPEIVRSPYDYINGAGSRHYDRDRYDPSLNLNKPIDDLYKLKKPNPVPLGGGGSSGITHNINSDRYDYHLNHDKKDRVTPKPLQSSHNTRQ